MEVLEKRALSEIRVYVWVRSFALTAARLTSWRFGTSDGLRTILGDICFLEMHELTDVAE